MIMDGKSPSILISPSTETRGSEFSDYSLNLSHAYTQAIIKAGGVPLVIPCETDDNFVAEAVRRCDGVMISGGEDLQPELYSEELKPGLRETVGPTDPPRDLLESSLIREAFQQQKPLFAICRGHQLLNVALGGSLFVDVKMEVPGAQEHRQMAKKGKVVHDAAIRPGSFLEAILGVSVIGVNSTHHQAVSKIADSLQACATSPDGIVEALELNAAHRELLPWLLSVQFHPERLLRDHPIFHRLFESFVQAAKAKRTQEL